MHPTGRCAYGPTTTLATLTLTLTVSTPQVSALLVQPHNGQRVARVAGVCGLAPREEEDHHQVDIPLQGAAALVLLAVLQSRRVAAATGRGCAALCTEAWASLWLSLHEMQLPLSCGLWGEGRGARAPVLDLMNGQADRHAGQRSTRPPLPPNLPSAPHPLAPSTPPLQAKAFACWWERVQWQKQMRLTASRVARRMLNSKLAQGFYTWLVGGGLWVAPHAAGGWGIKGGSVGGRSAHAYVAGGGWRMGRVHGAGAWMPPTQCSIDNAALHVSPPHQKYLSFLAAEPAQHPACPPLLLFAACRTKSGSTRWTTR